MTFVKRGTASRLGLHDPRKLRIGMKVRAWHLNSLADNIATLNDYRAAIGEPYVAGDSAASVA